MDVRIDHRPTLGPVRDQGARPTCLSHATTTAHEHARGTGVRLSPEYLHYFASAHGGHAELSFPDVTQALRDQGQPVDMECPYHPNGAPKGWFPPIGIAVYRRESEIKLPQPQEVEALLLKGSIPILGISMPDSFFSPTPPWLISAKGPVRGLHTVVAVAVASGPSGRAILVRNSWGKDWGDNGHAWLDDSYLTAHLRELLVLTHEVTDDGT
jgi:hypothetical protein